MPSHTRSALAIHIYKKNPCRVFLLILAVTLFCTGSPCFAEDKNGVAPNVVSLPSGPGSIEGLGTAFQPMLNTGNARYTVPISVPTGTAGNTPSLSLQYDSGLGDGPIGIGWSFGPGGISRQTDKGIPRYVDGPNSADDNNDGTVDDPAELDRFVGPDGEELVRVAEATFRARIEGSFVRYRRVADYWVADLKNGTTLEFGRTSNARITDESGTKTFRWLLERSIDANGNVIEYHYTPLAGSDNNKYLREIRYGPGASPWTNYYFVHFTYESRPDWRKDYRSSFLVKTAHRLKQVDIGIQGVLPPQCLQGDWNQDTTKDALISRYLLTYTDQAPVTSQLAKVTRYGADGVNSLPPISFTYSSHTPSQTLSAAQTLITGSNTPLQVMDNSLIDLIDLNRDGLADILKTNGGDGIHRGYLNLGPTTQGSNAVIAFSQEQQVSSADGQASLLPLSEDRINLADMGGDGLADLVYATVDGNVYVHANQGDLSWGTRKAMSIQDTTPPFPFSSKDVITADMDFNKRIDVVQSTDSGYAIWFNLEGGKYSNKVQGDGARYQGQVLVFSAPGVQTADMNGDRLSDVIKVTSGELIYCAALGHGNYADAVSIPIPDMMLTDGDNGQIKKAKLTDINGDGLADLVVERAETGKLWFWLNLGTDQLSPQHIVSDMPVNFGANSVVRWADMNGNATTDLVYADSEAADRLQILDIGLLSSGSSHPNLLTTIKNGLGVTTTIAYRSSTEFYLQAKDDGIPWQSSIPFPVQVVASTTVTTGLDLDMVSGLDVYEKRYSYRDGFYEDIEKQFRGFAKVWVTEPGDVTAPTKVTLHEFFTGGPDGVDNDGDSAVDEVSALNHREEDALKGLVLALQSEDEAGTIFSRSENSWSVKTLLTSSDNIEIRFAYKTQTDTIIDERTGSPETLRSTFAYDDYGNITEERKLGALFISGDERFTFSEYINDTRNWLLGLPSRTYITDASLQKAAETFNYYDGAPFVGLPLGQATTGLLTRQQQWQSGTTYIDSIRNEYDSFGNIITIRDANGSDRSLTWEPDLHKFPVQEDIEVGNGNPDLSIIAAYNLGLGVVSSSRDFNNNEISYNHDSFGRVTAFILPGDSSELPSKSFQYTMVDPEGALQYAYDKQGVLTLSSSTAKASYVATKTREVSGEPGTFDTISYVDGLGRNLATITEGEQGFVVNGANLLNSLGRTRYSFLPYAAVNDSYQPPILNDSVLEYKYDALGRVIETINPPDAGSLITSSTTSYLPLASTSTNENSISKTIFYDGLERLIRTQENNLGETYLTSYMYNTLGKLTGITDAQNNTKTMAYDGLGRKTSMEDPDKGHMEYEYDLTGNLIRTLDNKNQETLFSYDKASRMLTIDYRDAANINPDVTYHYDSPSTDYPAATNLKGKISWIEDLSGGLFFSYDSRGNSDWTVTRIDNSGSVTDYTSRSEHDAMGRVIASFFPDDSRVEYHYNNRSLLEAIPGFIDNIDYFVTGQRSLMTLSNGISTSYAYDPRQRLNHLVSTHTTAGNTLQDLSYTFDGISNITEITDGRSLPADSPKDNTQTFGYDDLSRLTSVLGAGYGAIGFQYDKIGNMIFKGSPAGPDPNHIDDDLINLGVISSGGASGTSNRGARLPGADPGPHAVSSTTSGLAYDYDDNGNMTSRGVGDSYQWDFSNRLIQADTVSPVSTSTFVYDAAGKRKIKKADGVTDYYVTSNYEIRDTSAVKYIFDGVRRIARVQEGQLIGGESTEQQFHFTTGWNFFGLNIEPDTPAVTELFATISGSYTEIWGYNAATETYQGYVPSEGKTDLTELHAGYGYIIKATTPVTIKVSGITVTTSPALAQNWNLLPCPSDAPIPLEEALTSLSGKYDAVWGYDSLNGQWQTYTVGQPDFLNNLDTLKPGNAYWIKMNTATTADPIPFQSQQVNFYHTDHLGSTSLVTDATGTVVEETAFYPFGRTRYKERNGFDSSYKYTGKELDKETGLMYYEARYYDPVVGRFISVDPLYAEVESTSGSQFGKFLTKPQSGNLYAYTHNNPVNLIDPSGLDDISMEDDELKATFLRRNREARESILSSISTSTQQFQDATAEVKSLQKQIEYHMSELEKEQEYLTQEYDEVMKQEQSADAATDAYTSGKHDDLLKSITIGYQMATNMEKFLYEYKKKQVNLDRWILGQVSYAAIPVQKRTAKIDSLIEKHTIALEKRSAANSARDAGFVRLEKNNVKVRADFDRADEIQKFYREQNKRPTGAEGIIIF